MYMCLYVRSTLVSDKKEEPDEDLLPNPINQGEYCHVCVLPGLNHQIKENKDILQFQQILNLSYSDRIPWIGMDSSDQDPIPTWF